MEMEKTQISRQKEVTLTAAEANIYALVFLVPLILILFVPYYFLWSGQFTLAQLKSYLEARESWTFLDIGVGAIVLLAGIVAHELLHGLGWSFYTKNGWKSIRFGVIWNYLTPYCHCSEPLIMKSYRIGSLLPALILGMIPSIVAMATGNLVLFVFGFFFTFAAGGDFLILWMLRKEKSNVLVQDHADKIGCIIIQNP